MMSSSMIRPTKEQRVSTIGMPGPSRSSRVNGCPTSASHSERPRSIQRCTAVKWIWATSTSDITTAEGRGVEVRGHRAQPSAPRRAGSGGVRASRTLRPSRPRRPTREGVESVGESPLHGRALTLSAVGLDFGLMVLVTSNVYFPPPRMTEPTPPPPTDDERRAAACRAMAAAPGLIRFASRYTRSLHDAEDAYQRTMEIALTRAPVTEPRRFMAWLHTVLRNEALAVAGARRREGPERRGRRHRGLRGPARGCRRRRRARRMARALPLDPGRPGRAHRVAADLPDAPDRGRDVTSGSTRSRASRSARWSARCWRAARGWRRGRCA